MPIDLPTVTFDWPSIVECAQQKVPDMPANVPQVGQDTDTFLRNYAASQAWGAKSQQLQTCQVALNAWMAGWEAGHAGKPKDPTAK